jgi:cysteinyl-tRNA synthetase
MTGSEKMSHSLLNFTTIQDVFERYEPAALRLALLGVHYRSPMSFSEESLASATRNLRTLRAAYGDPSEPADGSSPQAAELLTRFGDLLDDDFNTPGALGVVFDTAHEVNRVGGKGAEGQALRAAFREMIDVLGIPLTAQDSRQTSSDASPFIELLIEVRAALRTQREWALADRVRDRLKDLGVAIEDTADGTVWRFERPASSDGA